MRINYVIIFVSDMDRSLAFYRDVVGMPLRFASAHWSEFATEGATWALHLAEGSVPGRGGRSKESAGTSRPGFHVVDLDAYHARMLQHDVPCPQAPKDTFGTRIAQYMDPDGLLFSVSGASPNGDLQRSSSEA